MSTTTNRWAAAYEDLRDGRWHWSVETQRAGETYDAFAARVTYLLRMKDFPVGRAVRIASLRSAVLDGYLPASVLMVSA
jgi:hypothetical protein